MGRHFPCNIEPAQGAKWMKPSRACFACNFSAKEITSMGYHGPKIAKECTSYFCKDCDVALCIHPCFKIYQTEDNYKKKLLEYRAQ